MLAHCKNVNLLFYIVKEYKVEKMTTGYSFMQHGFHSTGSLQTYDHNAAKRYSYSCLCNKIRPLP